MGRRASPSPSRGRRTRGAAFQRSGGGGLIGGGGSETPSRETTKELQRHGGTETRGEGTGRPREREHQDPGREDRETRGEGTRKPGEREYRDLGREDRETRGEEPHTRGENTEPGRQEGPTAGHAGTAGTETWRQ